MRGQNVAYATLSGDTTRRALVSERFGTERVDVTPPIDELLASGSLLTTRPGEFTTGDNHRKDGHGSAFLATVPVRLRPVVP